MKIFFFVSVFFFLTWTAESARILGIFPLPGKSHYILGSALMKALAERGHDVTVISPYGEKTPPKGGKYRDIVLQQLVKEYEERKKEDNINMFDIGELSAFISVPFIAYLISDLSDLSLREPAVQELINSGEKFDAVIVEQFYSDSHKSLAAHFDAVQIVFTSHGANFWVNPTVGNPSPTSYVPDTFLSFSPQMTFCERVKNTLIRLLNEAVHHLYLYPKYKKIAQKYLPNAPDFYDVMYNTSLVLLNSHPSIHQAVPHVPNMIEIGGFHIKPPKKLPENLQKFLDDAKEGVIYFSMGSNLQSSELPAEKREAILKTFSKLKQKVLWKWEDDVLPEQPENVKLGKWLPQQDILAHPNIKLFITHGGLLSTTETVYHGVPVLAIPIYGDQPLNAQLAVLKGFGLVLPFKELNEETLTTKITELLNNHKYTNNAKKISKVFHDREVKPMDMALYWVDYVIRHQGAPHLRVAATDLPWYQYLLLDVIAILAIGTLLGVVLTCVLLRKVSRSLCSKKNKKVKKN